MIENLSFIARLGYLYFTANKWSIIRNERNQYIVLEPDEELSKSHLFVNNIDLAWWLESEATDRMYMNTAEFFRSIIAQHMDLGITPDLIDESVANLLLQLVNAIQGRS